MPSNYLRDFGVHRETLYAGTEWDWYERILSQAEELSYLNGYYREGPLPKNWEGSFRREVGMLDVQRKGYHVRG